MKNFVSNRQRLAYCDKLIAESNDTLLRSDMEKVDKMLLRAKANCDNKERYFWMDVLHEIKVNGARFDSDVAKITFKRS